MASKSSNKGSNCSDLVELSKKILNRVPLKSSAELPCRDLHGFGLSWPFLRHHQHSMTLMISHARIHQHFSPRPCMDLVCRGPTHWHPIQTFQIFLRCSQAPFSPSVEPRFGPGYVFVGRDVGGILHHFTSIRLYDITGKRS